MEWPDNHDMGHVNCYMGKVIHSNYITIAKALSIILMVIGHSGCPKSISNVIYLFHMPLFFFCSGIFYRRLINMQNASIFLGKRFKGLYVPFVKWSILFMLLHNLFMVLGIYNPYYGYEGGSAYYTIGELLKKLFLILFTMHDYEELLGGFWFIRALFITSVLIAAFSILLRKVSTLTFEFLCLLFLVLTVLIRRFFPDPEFLRDISMGTFGAFFYMSGYFLMQYRHYWHNITGAIFCLITMIVSFCHFKDGISMGCGYNKVLPFYLSALSGTLLTIYLSKQIESKMPFLKRSLYYIGNHTLEILALHFLCFLFVSYLFAMIYGIDVVHVAEHPVIKDIVHTPCYWWIIYSVAGIVIPLFLYRVWQAFLNKVLWIKQ